MILFKITLWIMMIICFLGALVEADKGIRQEMVSILIAAMLSMTVLMWLV